MSIEETRDYIMAMISDIRNMTGNIRTDEPMSKHTSFCIGGEADIFIEIQKLTQLRKIVKYAKTKEKIITISV